MRAVSTFSGIGGGDLGLERAGVEIVAQVEIDRYCQRVLARRWPNVSRSQDVTTYVPPPLGETDVVVGGSPCQDLSVAGRRAGLAGSRSRLFYDLVRILDESGAGWLLFENVPGLLSSHSGRDFAVALGAITGYEPDVPKGGWRTGGLIVGPRRSAAWRVLDAQYFGLAQRRRRLFLVAHPRADRAGEVLLVEYGGGGHPPTRDQAWTDATAGTGERVANPLGSTTGGIRTTDVESETYVPEIAYALRASESKQNGSPERSDVTLIVARVADTLTASGGPGQATSPSRMLDEDANLIVYRKTHRASDVDDAETWTPADVANTLNTFDGGDSRATELVAEPFAFEPRIARKGANAISSVVPPLTAESDHGDSEVRVVYRTRVRRLTITERERLQGFPDGWTCLCGVEPYSTSTCTCPDGPRARALGNAMPVNPIEWIARRMVAASSS